jgi:glutathione peroxidase
VEPGQLLEFTMKDITGRDIPLRTFGGRVLLVVNVASRCGFTPQYRGLQELHERYHDSGLAILAFPANNFLRQEPGSDEEIRRFCTGTYSVTFQLFSKISVRGRDIHPLYQFLTRAETNTDFPGKIRWNFTKFLVDRRGCVVGRFEPRTDPLSPPVIDAVKKALAS